MKIQSKLQPNYLGIFKVSGYTPKGNYYLDNGQKERLKQSYPRSRLKVVDEEVGDDESEEDHMEVEEVRDVRKRRGKLEYFVKWKELGEEECTWEPENHFDTTECIQEFWDKRNKIQEVNLAQTVMSEDLTEKQKRVSFRNKISLTLKLILVLIILNYNLYFANAFIIRDSFKFCEIHENRAI